MCDESVHRDLEISFLVTPKDLSSSPQWYQQMTAFPIVRTNYRHVTFFLLSRNSVYKSYLIGL